MKKKKKTGWEVTDRTAAWWWRLRRGLWWFISGGSGGSAPGEGHALFQVHPPTDCCGSLKRPLLLLSLLVTDLRSLCSKIIAEPSTTVLMHMKQNSSTLQTHSTRACTDGRTAAKPRDIGPAFKVNLQEALVDYVDEAVVCLKWINNEFKSYYLSFPYAGVYCFKEIRLILLAFRHFYYFLPY